MDHGTMEERDLMIHIFFLIVRAAGCNYVSNLKKKWYNYGKNTSLLRQFDDLDNVLVRKILPFIWMSLCHVPPTKTLSIQVHPVMDTAFPNCSCPLSAGYCAQINCKNGSGIGWGNHQVKDIDYGFHRSRFNQTSMVICCTNQPVPWSPHIESSRTPCQWICTHNYYMHMQMDIGSPIFVEILCLHTNIHTQACNNCQLPCTACCCQTDWWWHIFIISPSSFDLLSSLQALATFTGEPYWTMTQWMGIILGSEISSFAMK